MTADQSRPYTVEGELAELIRQTLDIVERACVEPPVIEPARAHVIDVDAVED